MCACSNDGSDRYNGSSNCYNRGHQPVDKRNGDPGPYRNAGTDDHPGS